MTTITDLKQAFGSISGGRVLDVATGSGGFLAALVENLGSYSEIVGVDTLERAIEGARQNFKQENIRFEVMDAEKLTFPDASFDTVCIANSLHHMADLPIVLAEMKRVLKPGGYFIIFEMFRDDQTEAQMTHVLMHHWWAAVDSASGVTHNETYTRQQIHDLAQELGLQPVEEYEAANLSEDPFAAETIQYLESIIDRYIQRVEGLPDAGALKQRGEELRQRLHQHGFQGATTLILVLLK